MKLKLFDLHCDTPSALYRNNFHLDSSPAAVSLDKVSDFSDYAQIMAIWSDCRIADNTAFFAFHKIADYLNFEVERLDGEYAWFRRHTAKFRVYDQVKELFAAAGKIIVGLHRCAIEKAKRILQR